MHLLIRYRCLTLIVIITTGVLLTSFIYHTVYTYESSLALETQRTRFIATAKDRIQGIAQEFESDIELISATAAFFKVSVKRTALEFDNFGASVLRGNTGIDALAWAPRVNASQRKAVESGLDKRFPGTTITDDTNSDQGTFLNQDDSFPIVYITPYLNHEMELGRNLNVELRRHNTIVRAQNSGTVAISEGLRLVRGKKTFPGILVIKAVYRGAPTKPKIRAQTLEGVVVGVLKIDQIVETALQRFSPGGVDIWIYEGKDKRSEEMLYGHLSRARSKTDIIEGQVSAVTSPFLYEQPLRVADRNWWVVTSAAPGFYQPSVSYGHWGVLIGGTLLTLLAVIYVISLQRSAIALERANGALASEVAERKADQLRLRRLNRMLSVLSQCSSDLVRAESIMQLVEPFCDNLVKQGGYRQVWVARLEGRSLNVLARAGCGKVAPQSGDILEGGLAFVSKYIDEDEEENDQSLRPIDTNRSGRQEDTILPLCGPGGVFGVLAIEPADLEDLDEEEISLLQQLAGDLSYGIQSLEIKEAKNKAEHSLHLRTEALDAARDGVMIVNCASSRTSLEYANPTLAEILGIRHDELSDAASPARNSLEKMMDLVMEARPVAVMERGIQPNGVEYWYEVKVSTLDVVNDLPSYNVGIIRDVTDRIKYQKQLEHQAYFDELTGLPNRNLLADRLNQAMVLAKRNNQAMAVLFLDLNRFKQINDGLDHSAGDEVLRCAGRRLEECVRSIDTVARYGGDEFVVVLPGAATADAVTSVAKRIHDALTRPLMIRSHELYISTSIGAVFFPNDGDEAETLLKHADIAMYYAKENSREMLRFFSPEMHAPVLERLTLENELRQALDAGELRVFYQPQVDLIQCRVVGVEALIRWQHPTRGLISPNRFIPLAEETGLIVPIGAWVMQTAVKQMMTWQRQGLPLMRMAVNLSPKQLEAPDIVDTVQNVLADSGLPANLLELEVTEGAVMKNPEIVRERLKAIRELGVQLSIDDFGTGYSSLNYLKQLPITKLKIDQTFVREIISDPHDAVIAKTIVGIAHNMHMEVVAEGVETEAQMNYLHRHGCHTIQGYYVGPPLPDEDAMTLIRKPMSIANVCNCEDGPAVLILDDDKLITKAISRSLRNEPYRILLANDAQQGFELLANNEVAVVISDHRMPVMSGTEFLGRVRELYPDALRIILSGYQGMDMLTEAINHGWIYKFLQKPWDDEDLRNTIRDALQRYQHDKRRSDNRTLAIY